MPTTKTILLYKYDELSDAAKAKARDWFREAGAHDEWWDSVYEDAETVAKLIGIEMDDKPVKLMGGGTRHDPCIWFSGFSSQGDGACFEGRYTYRKRAHKLLRGHIGNESDGDKRLLAIVDGLLDLQKRHGYRLEARVKHSGHYYHDLCTHIDVTDALTGNDVESEDAAEALRCLLRCFMKWIYRRLEDEYEYLNSDDTVTENIKANDYTFTEDGSRED